MTWPVLPRLRAFLQSESLRTPNSGNLVTKAEPVPEASSQVFGHIFSFFLSLPTAHRSPGTEVPFPLTPSILLLTEASQTLAYLKHSQQELSPK